MPGIGSGGARLRTGVACVELVADANHDATVICFTAEIFANIALRDGAHALVDDVIMDEFHYYSDHSRGAAWQIPLLTLPRARPPPSSSPTNARSRSNSNTPPPNSRKKSPSSTNRAARPSIWSTSPRTPVPTPPATCSPPRRRYCG